MFSLPEMRPPNVPLCHHLQACWYVLCRLKTAQRVQVLGVELIPRPWQRGAHTVDGVLAGGVEVEIGDGDVDELGLRSGRVQAADVRAWRQQD